MCLLLISCSKQKARDAIYNSYHNHINGFAAVLEEEDAAKIASTVIFPSVCVCALYHVY